jgi:uncharacterized protein
MKFHQNQIQPQPDDVTAAGDETTMRNLIEYVVRQLVDHPDAVEVREVEGAQTRVLELRVMKSDMGKVIGKQGRTARALRTILNAASARLKKHTILEILE